MASYNIIENNRTFTCANGIYLDTVDDNIITNNLCTTGTLNGIYITASDRNKITNNTVTANDSNTANPQGGVYIDADSDYNIVSSNSITNNNNIGIGSTYGVYIANANCGNNVISDNVSTGNDYTYLDLGTQTDIVYYCSTITDISDAITSIGANAGKIIIEIGNYTLSSIFTIAGGGSYDIEGQGEGTVLISGDYGAFSITSASFCSIKNLKIDGSGTTTAARNIISVSEGADSPVYINRVHVIGGSTKGRCIYISSNSTEVSNCILAEAVYGIYIDTADNCKIQTNNISAIDSFGIFVTGSSTKTIINSNDLTDCGTYGIHIDTGCTNTVISNNKILSCVYGTYFNLNSTGCLVTGNVFGSNTTTGIYLATAGNICMTGNNFYNNNTGIYVSDGSYVISGNVFQMNISGVVTNTFGIQIAIGCGTISGNYIMFDGDPVSADDLYGIKIDGGILNTVSGNVIYSISNTGVGTGYGVRITGGSLATVVGNTMYDCDTEFSDAGANTLYKTASHNDPYNNIA